MDPATLAGLLFAFGALFIGQALEGGHAGSLVQGTAFFIVVGGTLGAVAVSAPGRAFVQAARMFKLALFPPRDDTRALTAVLLGWASLARKEGVLALEPNLDTTKDPFLKRALQMVVDGVDRDVTREVLEVDVDRAHAEQSAAAKLWESAGGFAPTMGILGAVLGLIRVMENLSDPSKLGAGIATAFVATVYGVGVANLFLIPVSHKLRARIADEAKRKGLILEAALGIQEGLPTSVLAEKLSAFSGLPVQAPKTVRPLAPLGAPLSAGIAPTAAPASPLAAAPAPGAVVTPFAAFGSRRGRG